MADEDILGLNDEDTSSEEEGEDSGIEEGKESGEKDREQNQQSRRRRPRRESNQQQKQPPAQGPALTTVPAQSGVDSIDSAGSSGKQSAGQVRDNATEASKLANQVLGTGASTPIDDVKDATSKAQDASAAAKDVAARGVGRAAKKMLTKPLDDIKQVGKEIKNIPRDIKRTALKDYRRAGRWLKNPKQGMRSMGRLGRMKAKGIDLRKDQGLIKPAIGSAYDKAKKATQGAGGALMGALGGQDKQDQAAAQGARSMHNLAQKAAETPGRAIKTTADILDAPRKVRETIKKAKKVGRAIRNAPKNIRKGVKAVMQAPQRIRQAIKATKLAIRMAIRSASLAMKAVKLVFNIIKALGPYLLIVLVIVIILAVVIGALLYLFGGGIAYINSLAGGSVFVPANYNNPEHERIVQSLIVKTQGCNPQLVIYDEGKGDIEWQTSADNETYNKLDIRLLKTLDYLTDNHRIMVGLLRTGSPSMMRGTNLIDISMSKAGEEAWKNQQNKSAEEQYFLDVNLKKDDQESAGYEVWHNNETLSAYNTGQAMAILEIDRSAIPELQDKGKDSCGGVAPPPVEIAWQETLNDGEWYKLGDNDETRTVWEELSTTVGFLDRSMPTYTMLSIADQSQIARIRNSIWHQLLRTADMLFLQEDTFDLYTETFIKIQRAVTLINDRIINRDGGDDAINATALNWFIKALANFDSINRSLNIDPKILEGANISDWDLNRTEKIQAWADFIDGEFNSDEQKIEWDRKIRSLGTDEIITKLNNGIRALYSAMNAANMVGWNDDGAPLDKQKAYESRTKIRQIILELKRMPNETYLEPLVPEPTTAEKDLHFDPNLVVKQIITFSPEDDLDNGQEQIDIFPRGLMEVWEDGTAFDQTLKDGQIDYADLHFSHAQIDNGVFSQRSATFIFKTPKSLWGTLGSTIDPLHITIPDIDRESVISGIDRLKDSSLGEIGHYMASMDPTGKQNISKFDPTQLISKDLITTIPVSFQKFLHIAF